MMASGGIRRSAGRLMVWIARSPGRTSMLHSCHSGANQTWMAISVAIPVPMTVPTAHPIQVLLRGIVGRED